MEIPPNLKQRKSSMQNPIQLALIFSRCHTLMKSFIHGKLKDPLQAIPDAKGLRYCFDYLRSIVLQHRNELGLCHLLSSLRWVNIVLGNLQHEVEVSVQDRNQLQQLKQKFGVTR